MDKITLVFLYSLIIACGQFLFKSCSSFLNDSKLSLGQALYKFIFSPGFILAVLLYFFAAILWSYILSNYALSRIYPIAVTFSILLTSFAGIVFLNEKLDAQDYFAYLMFFIGIMLLSR